MRKIFIAYSDANCAYSLQRIGAQAKRSGLFDEVILYTPDELPTYVKDSPLMEYKMGGGLWAWKPAIISETLRNHDNGDVVVYLDAGCSLNPTMEWDDYFRAIESYDTILFQYHDEMPEWEKFGQTSTKLKYWCKKSAAEYFTAKLGNDDFLNSNIVLGGAVIVKNKENTFINNWLQSMLANPELVTPCPVGERPFQIEGFGFHCHDQAVVTAFGVSDESVLILPEKLETGGEDVAIVASRYRCKTRRDYFFERMKRFSRKTLGGNMYGWLKNAVLCRRK